jgi:tetratricopeptide (TPR) repeat protein
VAGNRRVFEQAMRQGTNFAWDRQWEKAIAEYQRAIAELPDDATAYTALGQALVYAGRDPEALEAYQRAARLTPDDPTALARVAELQEESGDTSGAIKTWLHTADVHLRQRAVDAAIKVWQHLVELAPDTLAAHERLAKAYAGTDQSRKAVRQYLTLADILQKRGENERATAACKSALKLDPRDPDVLTALDALQHGRSIADLVANRPAVIAYTTLDSEVEEGDASANLVEMTRQKALTELAGALLEDSDIGSMELTAALMQAIDYQTRGEADAAIDSYARAINAGDAHVAAYFNLGLLYQEKLQFEEAIQQLQQVVNDSEYGLGAHFALGECWRAVGSLDKAVAHFVEVLRQLDLSTVSPEHHDVLDQSYADLSNHFSTTAKYRSVASFVNSLVEFLSGEHWEDRLFEIRQRLNRLGGDRIMSLAEVIVLPDFEKLLASMIKSQELLERGMLRSASEECLWAIGRVPEYLPLHLHLAQLFMQGNQVGMAITKYLYVADTFASRGDMNQARGLYEQVLRVAPMDLEVRQKLIALLMKHQMLERALDHQLALADAYYELAQSETSREQYQEALRLAARLPDSKSWTARILHRLGDIDLQRLDWRNAIDVYRQLKAAVPDDTRARRRLVELYLNLERHTQALAELDELIGVFRQQRQLKQAAQMLEELTSSRPDEMDLRKRAAQVSVETGNKRGAIVHLDAMGELQLQAGHIPEAVATIKAIIALGPENAEAYRQLLGQIA